MRTFRSLVVLVVVLATVRAAAAQTWTPFNNAEGRFTVSLPGTPSLTTTNDETPVGTIRELMYTLSAADTTYVVNYQDIPGLAVMFGGAGRIYTGARDGFLKDNDATQTSYGPITLQNRRGYQLACTSPATQDKAAQQSRVDFFLVGNRLYVVAATWPQSGPSTDVDRFFNSFQITK